jgi:CubicO group peptidase (beta-lactamase class C family)
VEALRQVDEWGAATAAAGVVSRSGAPATRATRATHGATSARLRLASVTKPIFAYAVLVAVEEGSVSLDDPAGPPGSTVRHLLAHASGLGFDADETLARPGRRRIYSNAGFDALAAHLEAETGMSAASYLHQAVFEPLGMTTASLEGSPAAWGYATLDDVLRFAGELLRPTLVASSTLAGATAVQFPGLAGVLPGIGRFDPLDWGLGFELRGAKVPHWTGAANSPGTFGHFGGSGTFLWVDPAVGVACAALTDQDFGPWALDAWPRLSDAVLAEAAADGI